MAKRCLAIIPAFNEAGAVGDVIRAIQRERPDVDVAVIDDGSRDATLSALASWLPGTNTFLGVHCFRLPLTRRSCSAIIGAQSRRNASFPDSTSS